MAASTGLGCPSVEPCRDTPRAVASSPCGLDPCIHSPSQQAVTKRVDMKRREFIAGAGGLAAMRVLPAAAQQGPVAIGLLHSGTASDQESLVAATREGLKEAGFVEGQNLR